MSFDTSSEAVVRLVLRRINQTRLKLCDFAPEGLRLITRNAEVEASHVSCTSVQEVNDLAFERVRRDCDVLELIEAVNQVSFDPPIQRPNRGD